MSNYVITLRKFLHYARKLFRKYRVSVIENLKKKFAFSKLLLMKKCTGRFTWETVIAYQVLEDFSYGLIYKKDIVLFQKLFGKNPILESLLPNAERKYTLFSDIENKLRDLKRASTYMYNIANGIEVSKNYKSREGISSMNEYEKMRLLSSYAKMSKEYGIVIFFKSCSDMWNELSLTVAKHAVIVGEYELKYDPDSNFLYNLRKELINVPTYNKKVNQKDSVICKNYYPFIKVLLFVPNAGFDMTKEGIVANLQKLEGEHGEKLTGQDYWISNNIAESRYVKNLLFSENNLRFIANIQQNIRDAFLNNLEELRGRLFEKNINIEDVVISGSGVLELLGVKEAHDVDFIVAPVYRNRHGKYTHLWSDELEYIRENGFCAGTDSYVPDNLLIYEQDFHVYYAGFKFINSDLIIKKKMINHREKDMRDIVLYQEHFGKKVQSEFVITNIMLNEEMEQAVI